MENDTIKARRVLEEAHAAWTRMAPVRERRRRYVRYTYGDQWSDLVKDRSGKWMQERQQLTVGGREPLSNNLIRRMVKAVVGRYRMNTDAAADKDGLTTAGRCLPDINNLDELDARTLEEFLISGIAVHRVWHERRTQAEGIWVDPVSPDRFFINAVRDPRVCDTELAGRITDMSPGEMLMRFARGDRQRASTLRTLYAAIEGSATPFGCPSGTGTDEDFFHAPPGRCRVIEVWTLECREALRCHDPLEATFALVPVGEEGAIARINASRRRHKLPAISTRWEAVTTWRCRMMAPDGTVLDEFDSPLKNGSHPFAIKLYPMVDGDVHSLVEDVIDQQRYVNRLITLIDRMMGTAAKGVLLFPTGCKLEGQKWQEVADIWADPGGVIPYRPYQGAEPHQGVTPMADFGARDLLQTQIGLFEDVSGVSEALMGKSVSGVVGVERYESEVRNASVAVNDLLKTFADFTASRNTLMQQFDCKF